MIVSDTDKKILYITAAALIITSVLIIIGLFFGSSLFYRYVIIAAFVGYIALAMYGLYLTWTQPSEQLTKRKYVRFVDQDPSTPQYQIKKHSPILYKKMEKVGAFNDIFPPLTRTDRRGRPEPMYIGEDGS